MPKISLWNPEKTNDYYFTSRIVGEHLFSGGTGIFVHKYLGVAEDVSDGNDYTQKSPLNYYDSDGNKRTGESVIQDLLFLENRDRIYSQDVYELRGAYDIGDNDFDMTQFGLFLSNDTVFINFHIESMVDALGRKLMSGDVIELPHLRDDLLLDDREEAINRFYVVQDGSRPASGYDPRWWPHLWRVKCGPITDSQEYRDIIGTGEEIGDLRDAISTYQDEIDISDAIVQQAENDVPYDESFQKGAHLYINEDLPNKPIIGTVEGAPNGVALVGSGESFPISSNDDDYFLRTDFTPNRLFKKQGTRWVKVQDDTKQSWNNANRILSSFINNSNTTTQSDGSTIDEMQFVSKVVKPKTDN